MSSVLVFCIGFCVTALIATMLTAYVSAFQPSLSKWQYFVHDICDGWMACNTSSVDVVAQSGSERTVLARHTIRKHEEVMAVPRVKVLTASDLLPDSSFGDMSDFQRLVVSLLCILDGHPAVANLSEDKRSAAMRWLEYVMPSVPLTSYPFFDHELEAAVESVTWMRASYHGPDSWPSFLSVCRTLDDTGLRCNASYARHLYVTVASRCFEQPLSFGIDADGEAIVASSVAVFPILDMVNHHSNPNVESICDEHGCWLEALRDVEAGEEITLSYGDLPDSSLLLRYGFVMGRGRNPHQLRISFAGCSVEVGDDRSKRDEELACLVQALGADSSVPAATWLRTQCEDMLHDLRGSKVWEGSLSTRDDVPARLLRSVWTDLDRVLDACARPAVPMNVACADDAAVLELAAWLTEGGAWLSPKVQIACDSTRGRGIVAVAHVQADEPVARIPYSMLLSNDAALADDPGLHAVARSARLASTNLAAVALLRQREDGRRWRPFVRAFPPSVSTTIHWAAAELAELQSSDLATHTAMRAKAIRSSHDALAAALPRESVPSFEELAWALSNVWARGHTIPRSGGTGRVACLSPLLDLFNTDVRAPTMRAAIPDADGGTLTMHAARALLPGEEATAPYGMGGPLSNARMLFDYGFCTSENAHDDVAVQLDATHCAAGAGALQALELPMPAPPLRLQRLPSPLPAELNAFARICVMSSAEAAAVRDAALARTDYHLHARLGAPLSVRAQDRTAAAFLAAHLRRRLDTYPTSVATDKAFLADTQEREHERYVCALRVRIAEKQILAAHIAALDPDDAGGRDKSEL